MNIPVLIIPVEGIGFRAYAIQPFAFSASGGTREEALNNLRVEIQNGISPRAEIATLEINIGEHPLAKFAGMFKDNPLFDVWIEAMAENRRRDDAESELL